MTILDKIIENKKNEVSLLQLKSSVRDLEASPFFNRNTISLTESLSYSNKSGIIAEFKRKSPSKGIMNSTSLVDVVAPGYFREGASGVSVLTDTLFFGGSNSDLSKVRTNNIFPILRKDFIISEYQVIESKSIGADAILLIAAVLDKKEIFNLSKLSSSLGLEVLLEIHEEEELTKLNRYINIIGVNNRNLKTFSTDTEISEKMAEAIPECMIKISESGISSPQLIKKLRDIGYKGFLIGEKFMCTNDPVKAFSEFVKDLNS